MDSFLLRIWKEKKFIENPYTKLSRIRTQSLIPISLMRQSEEKNTSKKKFFFIASSVGY